MVAITVILAAILATVAFGTTSIIPHTHTLVVIADQIDSTHIIITY